MLWIVTGMHQNAGRDVSGTTDYCSPELASHPETSLPNKEKNIQEAANAKQWRYRSTCTVSVTYRGPIQTKNEQEAKCRIERKREQGPPIIQ